MALVHDFIATLPAGYETRVGENGLLLSGGERQRLAIARAILKDAPILVLDEATANLDVATERDLMASLAPFMAGRTTLVISHRPSVAERLDRDRPPLGGSVPDVVLGQALARLDPVGQPVLGRRQRARVVRRVDARRVVGEVEVEDVGAVVLGFEVEVAAGAVRLAAARRVEERHEQRVASARRRGRRPSGGAAHRRSRR